MQAFSPRGHDIWTSFGRRRGVLDSAPRFGLDLTRARARSGAAAGPESYPSPPMSGSPPLPPKLSHGLAERSQGTYQPPPQPPTTTTTQDVYPSIPATQSEERTQGGGAGGGGGGPRSLLLDAPERSIYPSYRPRPPPYSQPLSQVSQPSAAYLPGPGAVAGPSHQGPLPALQAYPTPTHHPIPDAAALHNAPPKPQRKAKGHVASACVPCKKAHLRCDAQRPCSRCTSTNKEGACVDVQHKKRGRPRLRDDSQPKYEGARFGSGADAMRRPLSTAFALGPPPSLAESSAPRFPERGLASDANVYPAPPLSITTTPRAPEEPVAYLTVGHLEFSKASASFLGAIGRTSVSGLGLANVLAAEEGPRAHQLLQQAQEEQHRKDPAYLPPILNERSEAVMQSLGYGPEEVSRHPLRWLDTFTFLGDDGQARSIPARAGLGSRDSVYFVVLLLNRPSRPPPYPAAPSPGFRDMGPSFDPSRHHQPFYPAQPTPLSATFDPRPLRLSETGYDPRQQQPGSGLSPHLLSASARSPGLPSSSGYGILSPSGGPDYHHHQATPRTYPAPHTEMAPPPPPPPHQTTEYEYQQHPPLPRIRSPPPPLPPPRQPESPRTHPHPQPSTPFHHAPPREERSRMGMGIGGLLGDPSSSRPERSPSVGP
ncbi:hypothetical protein N658DRAFT_281075 [Parathielavia hyrcaniae]|uniref:Zn(2)-C6 fungal-type domain-containing protein n=1 Tax=Parathielavia hyrcaniae TaxID=113614 RepID=A0AAN6Q4U2_9PEZI|nr:hypothetical protein N658DRAFT_281075 [Parathielavia hyrcaniae]